MNFIDPEKNTEEALVSFFGKEIDYLILSFAPIRTFEKTDMIKRHPYSQVIFVYTVFWSWFCERDKIEIP